MTSLTSAAPWPNSRSPIIVGIVAAVILALVSFAAPRPVLHGWLIAFASVGGIPLGAFAWTMIHRLTGGDWGELARPALNLSVSLLPLLILFWLPLAVGSRLIYPWAANPASAGNHVAALFLNGGGFALRSLVGLVGLCVLGRFANKHGFGQLGAGLALVFFAVFMNFASFSWLLSLEPRFTSSAFGAQVIVQQLICAMSFVAVVRLAPEPNSAWKDIGALLLATTLGETYLILMTFIVFWYGDLPVQAEWYLRRTQHGWLWLDLAGIAIGSIGPLIALLFSRVRDNAGPLRIVGTCLLVGTFAQAVWLVAPVTEGSSAATALLAIVSMLGLGWGLIRPMAHAMGGSAHGR